MITKRQIEKKFNSFIKDFVCESIILGENEYILIKKEANKSINEKIFYDKIQLEALTNHTHLIDSGICFCKKFLCYKINELGNYILTNLSNKFPENKFIVFIELDSKNSVTIRFHQLHDKLANYYDINNLNYKNVKIYYFIS